MPSFLEIFRKDSLIVWLIGYNVYHWQPDTFKINQETFKKIPIKPSTSKQILNENLTKNLQEKNDSLTFVNLTWGYDRLWIEY